MPQTSNYIPGVCNINPREIRQRRLSGYFGSSVAIIGVIAFVLLHAPWPYYLVLFIPIAVGVLGFLQAKNKFCVAYASAGKHHADSDDVEIIDDENARKIDTLKSRKIYLEAFLIAVPITAICCLLPLMYS